LNFSDSQWWEPTAEGGTMLHAVNSRIEMTQGAAGFAAMRLVPTVSCNLTATVDYVLLNRPAANLERVGLNAFFTSSQQLIIERISNPQYDRRRWARFT
jgi:hypothetical protein